MGHDLDVILMRPDAQLRNTAQRFDRRPGFGNKNIGSGIGKFHDVS